MGGGYERRLWELGRRGGLLGGGGEKVGGGLGGGGNAEVYLFC